MKTEHKPTAQAGDMRTNRIQNLLAAADHFLTKGQRKEKAAAVNVRRPNA